MPPPTTHQQTFLSEITQISLQKVNHWHKVRFRETSEYAHWPTETLVPWSPLVTRYTGRLSQLPVVKMSWGKNSKKKPSVLTKFLFLINFIRHTGPRVTMVTKGHQAHRQAISAFSGQNELGEKFIVFSGNGCCGVGVEWLILRLILMLLVKNGLIYTRTIVILDLLLWLKIFLVLKFKLKAVS